MFVFLGRSYIGNTNVQQTDEVKELASKKAEDFAMGSMKYKHRSSAETTFSNAN